MSFSIKTDNHEWIVSMGVIIGTGASVWVAFNEEYEYVIADSLDHLYIGINQSENPEECQ